MLRGQLNVYPSHQKLCGHRGREWEWVWPRDDVLTKSTVSRRSRAHLVPATHTLFALRRPTSCRSSALWSRSSPRGPPLTSSPLSEEKTTTAMAHSVCRLVLLVLAGLLVAFVHAGKRCCFCALQPRCSDTAEAFVCLLSALKVLRCFLILLKRELWC